MNLQAYANHRRAHGLRGCSHVAVLAAINDGRLSDPAVKRNGRRWIINPDIADHQWASTTDLTRASDPPAHRSTPAPQTEHTPPAAAKGIPALAVSKQVKAAFDAKLTQLEYQQQNLELGSIAEMRSEAFTLAKATREAVLAVGPRISAELAATTDTFSVEQLLERELIAALRSLVATDG